MHNNIKTKEIMPKKGEMFAICANDIKQFYIDSKRVITDEKVNSNIIKNKYLSFMYLGDGLARETYSSEIFQLIFDKDIKFNKIKTYNKNYELIENKMNYYKDYKKILKNPLLLYIDENTKMYEYNKEIIKLINKDAKEKRIIGKHIEELNMIAKEILKIHMNGIIKKDYEDALSENSVYTLKKTFK